MTKGLLNLRSVTQLSAIALAIVAPLSFAQAQSYQVTTFDRDMISIEGDPNTTVLMTTNSSLVMQAMPFDFEFFGVSIASGANVVVSPHGWISMDPSVAGTSTDSSPDLLESTSGPEALVAPGWGSTIFNQANSAVNSLVRGTAPNRQWIVEWTNCRPADGTSTVTAREDGLFQVQVVFFESTSVIEFRYDNANEWSPQDFSGGPGEYSIGIENSTGTLAYSPISFGDMIPDVPDFNIRFTPPVSSAGIDLAPVGRLDVPNSNPAPGSSQTVTATIQNRGSVDSPAFDVNYYMSTDPVIDGNDILLATENFPALAAGAVSSSPGVVVTVPAATTDGVFYFGYIIDASGIVVESSESNNVTDGIYIPVGGLPNISATVTGTGQTSVAAGEGVAYSITVTNTGTGGSRNTFVDILGSNNNILSVSDSYMGTFEFPPLGPGESMTMNVSTTVAPSLFATGTSLNLGIILNLRRRFPNTTSTSTNGPLPVINITAPAVDVDLVAGSAARAMGAPAAVAQGDSFSIDYTFSNRGADDAATVGFQVFLSADRRFDVNDVQVGSFTVASIDGTVTTGGAAGSVTDTFSGTIPAAAPTGLFYLIVVGDSGALIGERSERNNAVATTEQILIITPGGGVDLNPTAISTAATSAAAGESIIVSRTIGNIGGASSGMLRYGVYLSTDATVDTSDTLASTFTLLDIASNGSDGPQDITVTIPAGLPAGSYFIGLIADDNGAIPELDESNNVVVAGAQLMVTGRAGDVNGDTAVNVMDVTEIVNQILGNSAQTAAADVNGDSNVDVLDVQRTINILLSAP